MNGLRVAIVGCGLIGRKRADAVRPEDRVVGVYDVAEGPARSLADALGVAASASLGDLLALAPDVVVVALPHDQLAGAAIAALEAGAHVLVEKPAALSVAQVETIEAAATAAGRLVKVGFNHRFHPGLLRLVQEVRSGEHGDVMHLRARYGHGGRPGYDREWRAQPARSGGGELIDQGMHLIDLTHVVMGELPLHSALLRTHFWDTPVDDNAVLVLGERDSRTAPWALLHVSWTEWKNLFSLEVYCRTAKLQVDGLVRSYGPQTLRIFRMGPELGPPEVESLTYAAEDSSWAAEWENLADAVATDDPARISGSLADARFAWSIVQAAYATSGYASMREQVLTA